MSDLNMRDVNQDTHFSNSFNNTKKIDVDGFTMKVDLSQEFFILLH